MLKGSTDAQRKRLKNAELEVRQSTHKMRDLSINIKLGHTQYILRSTDPDRHIFALSEEKKKKKFPCWLMSEKMGQF